MKVVFDKDGTLFDNTHREHLLPKGNSVNKVQGWTAFNNACIDDEPIEEIRLLYWAIASPDNTYIVTGAGEDSREQTEKLFGMHSIECYKELIMRPINDHRKAADFKRDVFKRIGLEAGDLVVDDDPHIIEMVCREFPGVHVLRVASKCAAVLNNVSASGEAFDEPDCNKPYEG